MLMIAYPIVAFISLSLDQPYFIISYLLLILFVFGVKNFLDKHWLVATIIFITIVSILYLIQQAYIQLLLFLPPILILLSLFILFSQSLTAGKTPLITLYAKLLGDKLEEKHLRYNRSLTIIWSALFFFMLTCSILLARFSSIYNWSLFTHVISYILVALLFIFEFRYRKHYFAGEVKGGFFQFISKIIRIRPSSFWSSS